MADSSLYQLLINLKMDTAQLQAGMDKSVSILQRGSSALGKVMTGAFEQIGRELTTGLLTNIKDLSHAITELADRGETVGSIADNFQKLSGTSDSIQKAQNALLGTASAFDLMAAANNGLIRNIPNLNANFARLAESAGKFADATGQNSVDVLNRMTEAISKGSNKALKEFGATIIDTGSKTGNMTAAMESLIKSMDRLAPLGDSVKNAQDAFNVALSDGYAKMGIAINNSDELTAAYRELATAVNAIDWDSVGRGIASLSGSFISLANSILPSIKNIEQFALGLEVALGSSARGKFIALKQEASELKNSIAILEADLAKSPAGSGLVGAVGLDSRATRLAEARARLAQIPQEALPYYEQMNAGRGPIPDVAPVKAAVDEVSRYAQVSGARTNKAVADDRLKKDQAAQDKLAQQMADAAARNADELRKQQEQAYQDGVQTWESLFQNAITGATFNLSDALNNVAVGFAGTIAQSIFGSLGGGNITSAAGLGQALGQSLLGELGATLGGSSGASGGLLGGLLGGGLGGGLLGSFGSSATVSSLAPSAASAMGIGVASSVSGGTVLAGGAAGTGILGALGPYGVAGIAALGLIGSQWNSGLGKKIEGFFGAGSNNPETQARHTLSNYVEDQLRNAGPTTFQRKDGSSYQFSGNLVEGDRSKFNKPGWADDFAKKAGTAQDSFEALAETIKSLSGVTEDVGGQFAAILGENLSYNLDNARVLFQKLGLSVEDMSKRFLDMGKKGQITWLKYNQLIQGATEASKEGLTAFGDVDNAIKRFIDSGAKGTEAIVGLRNIFIEAKEKGITSLEQLRAYLLKVMDPKQADAFFQALKGRGVTSIEQVFKLDESGLGAIVGDMQAVGVQFNDVGKQIEGVTQENTAVVSSNTQAIQDLTDAIRSKDFGGGKSLAGETAMASGGVVLGPTRTLSGEAGPEAILPLSRKGGRLGVSVHGQLGGSSGTVIHIDARGATPGVEKQIRLAMQSAEDRAVARMMRSMRSSDRRTM